MVKTPNININLRVSFILSTALNSRTMFTRAINFVKANLDVKGNLDGYINTRLQKKIQARIHLDGEKSPLTQDFVAKQPLYWKVRAAYCNIESNWNPVNPLAYIHNVRDTQLLVGGSTGVYLAGMLGGGFDSIGLIGVGIVGGASYLHTRLAYQQYEFDGVKYVPIENKILNDRALTILKNLKSEFGYYSLELKQNATVVVAKEIEGISIWWKNPQENLTVEIRNGIKNDVWEGNYVSTAHKLFSNEYASTRVSSKDWWEKMAEIQKKQDLVGFQPFPRENPKMYSDFEMHQIKKEAQALHGFVIPETRVMIPAVSNRGKPKIQKAEEIYRDWPKKTNTLSPDMDPKELFKNRPNSNGSFSGFGGE